jgi:rod shape determining protein RodA
MKQYLPRIDWLLALPVIILVILSLLTLVSLDAAFFRNQLISLIISIVAFILFSQVDIRALKAYGLPFYIGSILILFIVLVIGVESRGAVRWLTIFGVSFQFSEILKPFLAVSLAGYLSGYTNKSFRTFIITFILLAPIMLLIYFQPDLGNALIYVMAVGFTLFYAGYPFMWFIGGMLPFAIISPFLWSRLHDYQRHRVLDFLSPTRDPQGTSYNLIQAIIAVGSGQMIGKGFSQGSQSGLAFLPERHTDFIFASVAEGLGFVGCLIIVTAFTFLGWRIYKICHETDDTFCKILASTLFIFIYINFFVNIGMNVGILPVVGVTLPFVSFGGSSLLSNFIMLGMLSSISISLKRRDMLEIH